MGGSTVTIQNIIDNCRSLGDIAPVFPIGGQVNTTALAIANSVLRDLLSQAFNWKWNRAKVQPFCVTQLQQDYALVGVSNIGWLEHGVAQQINSTATPKPIIWLEVVRDLELTSYQFGRPRQISWLPNNQLQLGGWPGAQQTYTWPIGTGVVSTPANPPTSWIDTNGNVLTLAGAPQANYGTTGSEAVAAPLNSAAGATLADGSVTWIVCDPNGQGLRVSPLPATNDVVWMMYVIAQAKLVKFTKVTQLINPIPDDFSNYFEDGFIAYSYQRSEDAKIRAQFQGRHDAWMASLMQAARSADRERDAAGFVPTDTVMHGYGAQVWDFGPAWPFPPVLA